MRRLLIFASIVTTVLILVPAAGAGEAPPRLEGEWVVVAFEEFEAGTSDLHLMRPDGTEIINLTNGAAEDTEGELSPDGTAIVFSSVDADGLRGIWLMDVDGTDRRPLVDRFGRSPTWTPDGMSVVYVGSNDLRIVGRSGADDRALTSVDGAPLLNPSVSPDGSTIVFEASLDDARLLYTVPIDGGEATRITEESAFEPEWSPDGTRILFTTFRGEFGDNIWATNPDGSDQENLVPSPDNDFHATWSPDGSRVMYESVSGDAVTIRIYDLVNGTTVDVLSVELGSGPQYREPTWAEVALDAIVMAPAPTTTTTTTVAVTTTTAATPEADTSPQQESTDWLVIGLVMAIVAFASLGLGIVIGSRLRSDPPPPPPPPPEDDFDN